MAGRGAGKNLLAGDERPVEMPHGQITQPPDNAKNNLPKHGQEIYKEAFDPVEEQYGEGPRAHRAALSAVERKYENDQGNRVQKDS